MNFVSRLKTQVSLFCVMFKYERAIIFYQDLTVRKLPINNTNKSTNGIASFQSLTASTGNPYDASQSNVKTSASLLQRLDIKEETLLTLLCYLESVGELAILPPNHTQCRIICYGGGGATEMASISQKSLAIAVAISELYEKRFVGILA